MKKVLSLLLCAFLSVFSVSTLAQATDQNAAAASQSQLSPKAQKAISAILEALIVVNTSEIDAAKLAQQKSTNADVKSFAEAMDKEHSQNLQDTKDLGAKLNVTPAATDKTNKLKERADAQLKRLEALNGKNFDVAYADAMVKDHEAALKLIDDKLLPNAKNPVVVDHLKATREAVAKHLQMAQELQKKVAA